MMKKILLLISSIYLLLVGYTYPENTPNVVVNCALGNNIKIYFPKNDIEYLEVSDYAIISTKNSTVYGYTGNTNLYFPTFNEPYYRDSTYNRNLSITRVLENNLYPTTSMVVQKNYNLYLIALLGGIFIWVIFTNKRS